MNCRTRQYNKGCLPAPFLFKRLRIDYSASLSSEKCPILAIDQVSRARIILLYLTARPDKGAHTVHVLTPDPDILVPPNRLRSVINRKARWEKALKRHTPLP